MADTFSKVADAPYQHVFKLRRLSIIETSVKVSTRHEIRQLVIYLFVIATNMSLSVCKNGC